MTNNFKQSVLGWLQYGLTKDKEFKRKAILYTYTVISFFLGVVLGAWAVGQFGIYSAYVGFLPLAAARTFIAVGTARLKRDSGGDGSRGGRGDGRSREAGEGAEAVKSVPCKFSIRCRKEKRQETGFGGNRMRKNAGA